MVSCAGGTLQRRDDVAERRSEVEPRLAAHAQHGERVVRPAAERAQRAGRAALVDREHGPLVVSARHDDEHTRFGRAQPDRAAAELDVPGAPRRCLVQGPRGTSQPQNERSRSAAGSAPPNAS